MPVGKTLPSRNLPVKTFYAKRLIPVFVVSGSKNGLNGHVHSNHHIHSNHHVTHHHSNHSHHNHHSWCYAAPCPVASPSSSSSLPAGNHSNRPTDPFSQSLFSPRQQHQQQQQLQLPGNHWQQHDHGCYDSYRDDNDQYRAQRPGAVTGRFYDNRPRRAESSNQRLESGVAQITWRRTRSKPEPVQHQLPVKWWLHLPRGVRDTPIPHQGLNATDTATTQQCLPPPRTGAAQLPLVEGSCHKLTSSTNSLQQSSEFPPQRVCNNSNSSSCVSPPGGSTTSRRSQTQISVQSASLSASLLQPIGMAHGHQSSSRRRKRKQPSSWKQLSSSSPQWQ